MCKGCGTSTGILTSYITAYAEFKDFVLDYNSDLSLKGSFNSAYWTNTYKHPDGELYDQLCEKHSDLNFNKEYTYNSSSGPTSTYPTNYWHVDFVSIDVISDSDWDAEHSAGTSLGDIAMFYSVSPYPYIKSGYQNTFDWESSGLLDQYTKFIPQLGFASKPPLLLKEILHPIQKLTKDLVAEDLILLGAFNVSYYLPFAHIKFTDFPTMDRNHKITVTLTADTGQEFSSSVAMSF